MAEQHSGLSRGLLDRHVNINIYNKLQHIPRLCRIEQRWRAARFARNSRRESALQKGDCSRGARALSELPLM
jgi:hypothetical protein